MPRASRVIRRPNRAADQQNISGPGVGHYVRSACGMAWYNTFLRSNFRFFDRDGVACRLCHSWYCHNSVWIEILVSYSRWRRSHIPLALPATRTMETISISLHIWNFDALEMKVFHLQLYRNHTDGFHFPVISFTLTLLIIVTFNIKFGWMYIYVVTTDGCIPLYWNSNLSFVVSLSHKRAWL